MIFTLATGERALQGPDYRIIEALATRAVERAIVRGVMMAETLGGYPAVRDVGAGARTASARRTPQRK